MSDRMNRPILSVCCGNCKYEDKTVYEEPCCSCILYSKFKPITYDFENEIKIKAYKECIEKVNEIITEIYNKHIFGSNDLTDEEKDAVINFSDDVTSRIDNLLKESEGEDNSESNL